MTNATFEQIKRKFVRAKYKFVRGSLFFTILLAE